MKLRRRWNALLSSTLRDQFSFGISVCDAGDVDLAQAAACGASPSISACASVKALAFGSRMPVDDLWLCAPFSLENGLHPIARCQGGKDKAMSPSQSHDAGPCVGNCTQYIKRLFGFVAEAITHHAGLCGTTNHSLVQLELKSR